MIIREITALANMDGFGLPSPISGVLFGGEDQAHKFIIRREDGTAFAGTVTAKFLRYADDVTVPLTGSIEDGSATVTLIENCYMRPGRFKLTLYVTQDESTTAVYCCMGTVDRTDGQRTVDPGSEINLDVTDLINRINTATASVPADYTALLATIAPTFSASTGYASGEYVWYNGTLYRFTADHAAGAWTGTDATASVIGEDVSELKSAVDDLEVFCKKEISETTTGSINVTTGTVIQKTQHLVDVSIPSGTQYKFKLDADWLITKYNFYANETIVQYNCIPETEYTFTASANITNVSLYCNTDVVVGTGTVTGIVTVTTGTSDSLEERIDDLGTDIAGLESDIEAVEEFVADVNALIKTNLLYDEPTKVVSGTGTYVNEVILTLTDISDGDVFTFSIGSVAGNNAQTVAYIETFDSSDTRIQQIALSTITSLTNSVTIASGDVKVHFKLYPSFTGACTATYTNVKVYSGSSEQHYLDPDYVWSDEIEDQVEELIDGALETYDPQITPEKTTFFRISPNLVDPAKDTDGAYINQTNGNVGYLAGERVTDFIPVEGNTPYCFTNFNNTTNFYCRYVFYKEDKTYISGDFVKIDTELGDTVTSPATARWMRFSAVNTNFPVMIAKGNTKPVYEPYGNDYIYPQYIVTVEADDIIANVPKKMFALVGLETNIYFENLVENWQDYQWNIDCDVGIQLERGYRITPIAADVGSHTMDIYIKASEKVTKKVTTTLVVASASAGSGDTVKLIVLGDSTTDAGTPIKKLHADFVDDVMTVQTLGTRGTAPNNMEGRSGWTLADYFTKASITYTDGRGTIYNPFYNPTSQTFDASYYFTNSGVDEPDWFFINMGINDMFNYTSDGALESGIETAIERVDAMISSLQDAVIGIKVGICLTIPPNDSQDAFGKAYKCKQSRDRYKRNNTIWVNELIKEYDGREAEGIYLVPINVALDTVYNMGLETIPVNARNTDITYQSPVGNGCVHPATSGYWQIADVYAAFLKGNAE